MAIPAFDTAYMDKLLRGVRAGDIQAKDELVRAVQSRLELLTERMLLGFSKVARWADPGDIYQVSVMRLLRTLEMTPLTDTRGFFALASRLIRNELVNSARRFYGPEGIGANHDSWNFPDDGSVRVPDGVATVAAPAELESWTRFHDAVGQLPDEEREVFCMRFYLGWSEIQMAELLGVDKRTIRRRWRSACLILNKKLGGQLPEL